MRHFTKLSALALLGVATASCGDVATSGRAPVYLVIESIGAIPGGAETTKAVAPLYSDVLTIIRRPDPCSVTTPCPTVFADNGVAVFHLAQKDITSGVGPTTNNQVTLTRYHVNYKRADGRNTPGVDVPYGFDGAATITVPPNGSAELSFELVRLVSKKETPLVQLIDNRTFITTLAEVTFYGQDVVGNEIQATGMIQIDFGNYADQ